MATAGWARAVRTKASEACDHSVGAARKNARRAGTLAKSWCTSTVVPKAHPSGVTSPIWPPLTSIDAPCPAVGVRERSTTRATSLMDASASPRNPRVPMCSRSSATRNLLVAWVDTASGRSSGSMPLPSSTTRTRPIPPCSSDTSMRVGPESRAFSRSSLTTLAGRSTTSPAAIRLTTESGNL